MKRLFFAMSACTALVFFANDVLAYPGGNGGGVRGGGAGNVGGAVNNAMGNAEHAADGSHDGNQDGGNANVQENFKAKASVNNRDSHENGVNVGRGSFVNRSERLGDRDFDKHRVGALDESKYRDRHDDNWRYRHWGNEWWYWVPGGYWMYYRDNRWSRYDDNYVDYNESGNTQNSSFHGPYYEDQNGFYYMENGRRVYDPQIRRIAG